MLSTLDLPPAVATTATAARKVVMLMADGETAALLTAWCAAHGFDASAAAEGFHLTLFATVGPSDIADGSYTIEAPVQVEPLGFDAFGEAADTPALLTWSSLRLDDMRAVWLAYAAAEPTYHEFRPHVSLSYAWDGAPALDTLTPPDIPLVFDRLEVRSLDDEAKSTTPPPRKPAMLNVMPTKAAARRVDDQRSVAVQPQTKSVEPVSEADAVAKLPVMQSQAQMWIDEVDSEYHFDFSDFGETADDVDAELDGALECVGELVPIVKVATEAEKLLAAMIERLDATRDTLEEARDGYDTLAYEAQQALEWAGDAVEQLQQRRTEFA